SAPWSPGAYKLVVRGTLEDPAGNRLGSHFETSIYSPPGPPVDAVVPFAVGDALSEALRFRRCYLSAVAERDKDFSALAELTSSAATSRHAGSFSNGCPVRSPHLARVGLEDA